MNFEEILTLFIFLCFLFLVAVILILNSNYTIDIDMILERNKNILEACTFGEKDEITGEKVSCAIVKKNNISEDILRKYCKENFSDHKLPKKFYFIKEIPKTVRGKINRDMVKNFCLKNETN